MIIISGTGILSQKIEKKPPPTKFTLTIKNTTDKTISSNSRIMENHLNASHINPDNSSKKKVSFDKSINKIWHYDKTMPVEHMHTQAGYLASTISSRAKSVARETLKTANKSPSAESQSSLQKSSLKPRHKPRSISSRNYMEPTLSSLAKQKAKPHKETATQSEAPQPRKRWEDPKLSHDQLESAMEKLQFKEITHSDFRILIATRS